MPFWLKPFWLNFWPLGASVQEQRVIDQRVKDPKGQGPIGPRVQRANSPKGHRVFLGHWERWSRTNVSRTQMVRWRTGQRSQGGGERPNGPQGCRWERPSGSSGSTHRVKDPTDRCSVEPRAQRANGPWSCKQRATGMSLVIGSVRPGQ